MFEQPNKMIAGGEPGSGVRGWRSTSLGEQINLKRGYDLPSRNRQSGDVPIFSSSGISGSHNVKMAEGPGVITGRYGTIGQVFYSQGPYWPLNTTLYVQDFKGNNAKFIYYFLQRLDWEKYSDKSAVPGVNRNDVHQESISLPPLPEQRAIAGVLSSLDDKIDLLHRQNKTLEALAETLFRQWFVEDAQEDWDGGTLGDIVTVKYGKDHQKLNDGDIPAFGSGGIMRYVDRSLCSTESVLIPRKGSLGNIIYVNEPFWTVDTMFYTEMKIPNAAKYIYLLVKSQDMASMNVGSAVPSMTTDVLNNLLITIPSNDALKHFDEVVSPMFIKMKVNKIQIRTLEKLRDTLLPKLMSGEVRVA